MAVTCSPSWAAEHPAFRDADALPIPAEITYPLRFCQPYFSCYLPLHSFDRELVESIESM